MVIQCPACQTRFKIADEKVGPNGVQVRCSKCSNTFPVRPDSAATDALAPAPAPSFAPAPLSNEQSLIRPPSRPELGTERANAPAGGPPASPFVAPPPPGFGMTPPAGFPAAQSPGASPFGLPPAGMGPSGLPLGIPDPFAAIADGAAPPDGPGPGGFDPFGNSDDSAPALDTSLRDSLKGQTASLSPEIDPNDPDGAHGAGAGAPMEFGGNLDFGDAAAEAKRAAPAPTVPKAKEETLDVEGARSSAPDRIPRGPRPGDLRDKRKKAKPSGARADVTGPREPQAAYRFLLGLFFAGAFAGAYASLTEGTFLPSHLDRARLSLLLGPPASDPAVTGLAMTTRSGGYLETAPGRPRVFIAQGVAINASPVARGFLEVRGRLKDASGAVIAETKVPCGNSFREDQLRAVSGSEELSRFYVPLGDGGSNAKVESGSAVQCMVVFFDAPQPSRVAEYELEIVAAQPVS